MHITISIDLCGSTAVKWDILRLCGRGERSREITRAMLRQFFGHELYFHGLMYRYGVDPDHVFVVKPIGDEAWIVIDLPDGLPWMEINRLVAQVIHAALALASRVVSVDASEHQVDDPEAPVAAHGRLLHRALPFKIFVDTFAEDVTIETSELRYRSLVDRAGELFLPDGDLTQEDLHRVIQRLVGGVVLDGRRAALRSDYSGPEVDRFFRCTKWALPFVVTCGQGFVDLIHYDDLDGDGVGRPPTIDGVPTLTAVPEGIGPDGRSGRRYEHYYLVREGIAVGDDRFKGIPEPYAVYHLFHQNHGLWPGVYPRPEGDHEKRTADKLREWGLLDATLMPVSRS